MNLIKSFNKEYLKENIKKSKGLIILFFILVPLFTTLVTIFNLQQEYATNIVERLEVMWVNIMGMYVIPFVLSFALFGYIYKKQSVDFINSMPLNRKTIFVTNTIGGLILITIMQLLSAILLFICDAVCTSIIIFPGVIADIFILMWVAYAFVFITTNLAMAFSGTFLTQLVVTLLILFLVPFCVDSYNDFDYSHNIDIIKDTNSFNATLTERKQEYTLPYNVFSTVITGNSWNDDLYSTETINKMLILSIIYFIIGMNLFQKRKMENTEESFENEKIHLIVKALTIFPMIVVLNLIEVDLEFNVIAVAIICVYYFVFDFLVKRKVVLKHSIPFLIVSLLVIQGICSGSNHIKTKTFDETLNRKEIKSIDIGNFSYEGYYATNQDYIIKDEKIIDELFDKFYISDYKRMIEKDKVYYEDLTYINVKIKTNNGKEYASVLGITKSDLYNILEKIEKDTSYIDAIRTAYLNDGEIKVESFITTEEEKNEINTEIKNKIDNMNLIDFFELEDNTTCQIYKYYYKNHKICTIAVPIDITEKTFEMATKKMNQKTKELIDIAKKEDLYIGNFHIEKLISDSKKDENQQLYFLTVADDVINFLSNNYNKEIDMNKEYYIIKGNVVTYRNPVYFFTNNVDEIKKFIEKEKKYNDYEESEETLILYD